MIETNPNQWTVENKPAWIEPQLLRFQKSGCNRAIKANLNTLNPGLKPGWALNLHAVVWFVPNTLDIFGLSKHFSFLPCHTQSYLSVLTSERSLVLYNYMGRSIFSWRETDMQLHCYCFFKNPSKTFIKCLVFDLYQYMIFRWHLSVLSVYFTFAFPHCWFVQYSKGIHAISFPPAVESLSLCFTK